MDITFIISFHIDISLYTIILLLCLIDTFCTSVHKRIFTCALGYLDTCILGVASKQLRLLHGRVVDSTIVVNSLSPQMSELVEDAVDS